MRRPHALSLRAALALFVITLSAGPVAGQGEERKGPDRLLRILPVGEAPPFVVGFRPLEDRMVTVLRLDEIVSSMQGGAAAIESFAA